VLRLVDRTNKCGVERAGNPRFHTIRHAAKVLNVRAKLPA
jgi:hypothetical protein